MADQDYTKPNPYGKPPKGETLSQKHDRVSKFYTYQKKSDQVKAARGDVTAMDELMQIGRKKGGAVGAGLQREGAERKLGISSPQARAQDQANRPGGFNAQAMQGGVGALAGEGAAGGAASLIRNLLAKRAMQGGGQMAGRAAQQALPRPGLPTRPVPQQMPMRPGMPQGPRPGMQPQQALPPGRPQLPQPGQRPMRPQAQPQRALPAPQRALPAPAPKPAAAPVRKSLSPKGPQGKTGELARKAKDIARTVQKSKSNPKSSAGRSVTRIKVKGEPSVSVGASRNKISTGNVPKNASARLSTAKGQTAKASQRSGESTRSTASAGTKTEATKTVGNARMAVKSPSRTEYKFDGKNNKITKKDKPLTRKKKASGK